MAKAKQNIKKRLAQEKDMLNRALLIARLREPASVLRDIPSDNLNAFISEQQNLPEIGGAPYQYPDITIAIDDDGNIQHEHTEYCRHGIDEDNEDYDGHIGGMPSYDPSTRSVIIQPEIPKGDIK